MSRGMFQSERRCVSELYVKGLKSPLRCSYSQRHITHKAVHNGMLISWTDLDARNSKDCPRPGHVEEIKEEAIDLIGWRAWKFNNGLTSVAIDSRWMSKHKTVDRGTKGELFPISWDWTPSMGNSATDPGTPGLHTYKCPVILHMQQEHQGIFGSCYVLGDVVEHEKGYRSQELEIKDLYVVYDKDPRYTWDPDDLVKVLKDKYELEEVYPIERKQVIHWSGYYCEEHCNRLECSFKELRHRKREDPKDLI